MSANNIIYINQDTNKVYYQGCVDNDELGSYEGQFNDLKEAVNYAQKLCDEYMVEYGIRFIGGE